MSDTLGAWIAREFDVARYQMLRSISPTTLIRVRAPFAQRIVPAPGSIVASPEFGAYDPEPDYFFDWLRDSALVMDAVRLLAEEGALERDFGRMVGDYVAFGLKLAEADGAAVAGEPWGAVAADHVQFLRTPAELARVRGDAVLADTRCNPDGTLDRLTWARPQYDGPALRALTLMRARPLVADTSGLDALLERDLGFIERHWDRPCFDLWEERQGLHYYTRVVSLAALEAGAKLRRAMGDSAGAARLDLAARALRERLDMHWDPARGILRAHLEAAQPGIDTDLDCSIVLGALHADLPPGPHGVEDTRLTSSFTALTALFAQELPINARFPGAPALGRYRGDAYFGGGAWVLATLGAAELLYRQAARIPSREKGATLIARADLFLETMRALTPADGTLSEQLDRDTGAPRSAKNLAWSYAAFITARAARRRACALTI